MLFLKPRRTYRYHPLSSPRRCLSTRLPRSCTRRRRRGGHLPRRCPRIPIRTTPTTTTIITTIIPMPTPPALSPIHLVPARCHRHAPRQILTLLPTPTGLTDTQSCPQHSHTHRDHHLYHHHEQQQQQCHRRRREPHATQSALPRRRSPLLHGSQRAGNGRRRRCRRRSWSGVRSHAETETCQAHEPGRVHAAD